MNESKLEIVASGSLFSIETKPEFQLKHKVGLWEVKSVAIETLGKRKGKESVSIVVLIFYTPPICFA